MSTLKADTLQAKTTNGTLTLANNGTGKVELPADATIGGVAMTTTFASGATDAEKSNIMLNSFRIAEQGGLTVQGMVDGVSDVFTDESGVDTATSTDESYNAGGDYYENASVALVAAADWAGATGSYTRTPDGHVNSNALNVCIYKSAVISGDFEISFTWTTELNTSALSGMTVGFILASAIGSFNQNATDGIGGFQASGSNAPFAIQNTNTNLLFKGNWSAEQTTSLTAGDTFILSRVGSTFYVTQNGVLVRTMTATSSADVHLTVCTSTNGDAIDDLGITGTSVNSIIVSDTFTALSQPDTAFVTVWHEDVDSVTLNTDFTIEVSRDAGTTWTAGTLALATTLGADKIITCTIDISGQPAGTSMEYRAKFLNEKSQRLRGVSMQWS